VIVKIKKTPGIQHKRGIGIIKMVRKVVPAKKNNLID